MSKMFLTATISVSFACLALAGCSNFAANSTPQPADLATISEPAPPPPEAGPSELRPAYSSVPQKGLPPQTLVPGDCGLFLWSKTDTTKFIFFRRAGDSTASILIGDAETPLLAEDFSGDIFGQFFTEQTFTSRNSAHAVSLSFEPGDELVDGARIDNGILRITDPEGWLTTIPVLGVRACQSESDTDAESETET